MEDDVLEVEETFDGGTIEDVMPDGWRGVIAGLDRETGDGRYLATPPGGVRTREYPLSLTENHVGDGPAPVIGSVDRVWVEDGMLYGEGKTDLGGAPGANFARQLKGGFINTVSIHPDLVTAEQQILDDAGSIVPMDKAEEAIVANDYDLPAGWSVRVVFTDWRLAGLAVVPIPAYTEARIEGVYGYVASEPSETDAIVATVGGQIFNVMNFKNPKLTGPTPLTINEDGRIFGHVALWKSCYQYGEGANAFSTCTNPPHSATSYSRFHLHRANLGGGESIACGVLTYGSGHVAKGGLKASQENYADVATQAAKVIAGEDEFGIWISGEVLDSARDTAHDILDSPLSAHWEPDADAAHNLEMIAAHVVNVPGFAVRPIIASFQDGINMDGLTITVKIPQPVDELAVLADTIAETVLNMMEARAVEKEKTAAAAMKQVHAASVIARLQQDARNERVAALAARLEK